MTSIPAPTTLPPAAPARKHAGLSLHSVFQPVISVGHAKIVGHEALLRATDLTGGLLSATDALSRLAQELPPQQANETAARLHLESFGSQGREGWLFLNASPDSVPDRALVHERFGQWLRDARVSPHSVVVEIVETRCVDEQQLASAVRGFRDVGCLVAIDDFGAGESNFERIWRLQPDLVKLDRAMLAQASANGIVRRILPGIVSLLHEAGCLVVMEGIETEDQALIALESDCDFVQGYYFSRPTSSRVDSAPIRAQFENLVRRMKENAQARSASDQGFFKSFAGGLEACVTALEDGAEFFDACSMFLAVAGVQRAYLLDENGYQVGHNAESDDAASKDPRFHPCADGAGANWFRRPYFQRAINQPRKVQISRPYLSIRDAQVCVTLSLAFEGPDGLRVLCADLDTDHTEPLSRRAPLQSTVVQR